LTLKKGRYYWSATINSSDGQKFKFLNVDSPAPQTLDLLASDGMSELDFYDGHVTISYPRIMGTDQFAACYIDMYYERRLSPQQEYGPDAETLSDDWTIVRYLYVGQ
jgi:hypothetical protein